MQGLLSVWNPEELYQAWPLFQIGDKLFWAEDAQDAADLASIDLDEYEDPEEIDSKSPIWVQAVLDSARDDLGGVELDLFSLWIEEQGDRYVAKAVFGSGDVPAKLRSACVYVESYLSIQDVAVKAVCLLDPTLATILNEKTLWSRFDAIGYANDKGFKIWACNGAYYAICWE